MPEGAMYVGRPTKWGSPYHINKASNGTYQVWGRRGNRLEKGIPSKKEAAGKSVGYFIEYMKFMAYENPDLFEPLRGKTLACWCGLDQPCHADVLLTLANR
jgi:hypothetical protein